MASPRRLEGDEGFSLVEQMIAIMLMFGVLLGLLGALGASASGVVIGRQKTIATSLGKGVIETFHGSYYDSGSFAANVGMNLGEAGLSADPRLAMSGGNLTLEGKPLAGATTPVYPSHSWTITEATTIFTVSAYVTESGAASDNSHQFTVFVDWTAQGGRPQSLRFTSAAAPIEYATFPAADGSADASGASFEMRGQINSMGTVDRTAIGPPAARSTTSDAVLRQALGAAFGPSASVVADAGVLGAVACGVTDPLASSIDCAGVPADAVADNDSATQAPEQRASGSPAGSPTTYGGFALTTVNPGVILQLPAARLSAQSTSGSCTTCVPPVGDGDNQPWQWSSASATTVTSAVVPAGVIGLGGSLWTSDPTWLSETTVDHDIGASGGSVVATARLEAKALKVLGLTSANPLFTGAVKVNAFTATATAAAGYGTLAPATPNPGIVVSLWNGDQITGSYQSVTLVPGAAPVTGGGSILAGTDTVSFTSRVESTIASPLSETATTPTGVARTRATAQLTRVLVVTVDVTVTPLLGTARTFTIVADYGHLTAIAIWAVAP